MQKESLIKKINLGVEPEITAVNSLAATAREPLPTIQTYCQSKTFIATIGINGLTACASALFTLLNKLRTHAIYEDIPALKQNLIHEIKAFECAALNRSYTEQQIIIARYAICATLDDVILNTRWGAASNWREDTLLYIFQGEMWGGERLFAMLENLRDQGNEQVELLEFLYLCLSLGFEGKYRINLQDKDSFYSILDATYAIIKNTRGDLPARLSKVKPQAPVQKPEQHKKFSLKLAALITGGLICAIYLLFSYILNKSATPVLSHIEQIEQTLMQNDE